MSNAKVSRSSSGSRPYTITDESVESAYDKISKSSEKSIEVTVVNSLGKKMTFTVSTEDPDAGGYKTISDLHRTGTGRKLLRFCLKAISWLPFMGKRGLEDYRFGAESSAELKERFSSFIAEKKIEVEKQAERAAKEADERAAREKAAAREKSARERAATIERSAARDRASLGEYVRDQNGKNKKPVFRSTPIEESMRKHAQSVVNNGAKVSGFVPNPIAKKRLAAEAAVSSSAKPETRHAVDDSLDPIDVNSGDWVNISAKVLYRGYLRARGESIESSVRKLFEHGAFPKVLNKARCNTREEYVKYLKRQAYEAPFLDVPERPMAFRDALFSDEHMDETGSVVDILEKTYLPLARQLDLASKEKA